MKPFSLITHIKTRQVNLSHPPECGVFGPWHFCVVLSVLHLLEMTEKNMVAVPAMLGFMRETSHYDPMFAAYAPHVMRDLHRHFRMVEVITDDQPDSPVMVALTPRGITLLDELQYVLATEQCPPSVGYRIGWLAGRLARAVTIDKHLSPSYAHAWQVPLPPAPYPPQPDIGIQPA